MSYVTSVTIVLTYADDKFRAAVTEPSDFGRGQHVTQFREMDTLTQSGGTKVLQQDVFSAGLNYADREALRSWLHALPWPKYSYGVVLIDTEGENVEVLQFGTLEPWVG